MINILFIVNSLIKYLKKLKINRTLLRYRPRVSRASQSHDCMLLGALITLSKHKRLLDKTTRYSARIASG
ncbi:TPA: hypothetical protein ACPJQN_000360 [Haemophilus influenzae]